MTESTSPAAPPAPGARGGKAAWLGLAAIVIAADQLTKWLVVQHFELYERMEIHALLNLTRVHNTGAAFSLLGDQAGWQRWLFIGLAIAVSIAILIWIFRLPRRGHHWLAAALALVLGGAIGNVIDRINIGYVIDFIQVHWQDAYFPTFNVADVAISIGAFLLICDSLFGSGRSAKPETNA